MSNSFTITHEDDILQLPATYSNEPAIIIGVDFGTTYSGISWALTASPEDIYTIKSWPTKGNSTFEKVPTEISYHPSCVTDGSGIKYAWGFKAQRDSNRLKWIKLLLDPSQSSKIDGLSIFTERAERMIPEGMTALDVVIDYFKGLKAHLDQELSSKLTSGLLDVVAKEYVFTVPAIWSDKAKALTEKAAKAAGFANKNDEIFLVPEPEAAALCCLRTIQPNFINVGDNFVVVDCGGGTVDLISYQITKLSPLELRESAVGDGDLCGSVILNTLFETLVMQRMGCEKFTALKPSCRQHMLAYFDETVKRAFSDNEDEEIFTVPMPGVADDANAGIENGFFVLTREDMREIFRPVLERIQKLVEGQCSSIQMSGGKVSALLLVGGFGASDYLREFFKAWGLENGSIQVLQPVDAWSCIVRGAVMAGLQRDQDVIKSRLARRFYGVRFWEPFIDGHHPEKYRVWNKYKHRWFSDKRIRWFIRKGDKIADNIPIEHPFHQDFLIHEWQMPWDRRATSTLFAFDGDVPPRHSDAPGVYLVTSLKSDLSSIPDKDWTKRNYGAAEDVMDIGYHLRMILHGAMLSFELRHKGKRYGSVATKFE